MVLVNDRMVRAEALIHCPPVLSISRACEPSGQGATSPRAVDAEIRAHVVARATDDRDPRDPPTATIAMSRGEKVAACVGFASGVAVCLVAQKVLALLQSGDDDAEDRDSPQTPPKGDDVVQAHSTTSLATAEAVNEIIDAHVKEWHRKNASDINIGQVTLPVIGSVDLFPDHLEIALFKKLWVAVVSNVLETEFVVAGVKMRIVPVFPEKRTRALVPFLRRRRAAPPSTR